MDRRMFMTHLAPQPPGRAPTWIKDLAMTLAVAIAAAVGAVVIVAVPQPLASTMAAPQTAATPKSGTSR